MKGKQAALSSFLKPKMASKDSSGNSIKTEKYMPSRQVERTNRLTYDDNEGMASYGLNSTNTSKWENGRSSFSKDSPGKYTNGFVPNRVDGAEPDDNRADLPSLDPKFDEEIKLSGSQKRVLDMIMQRKSVFFTGAAGTGKSFILRVLSDIMDKLGKSDRIAFTASTGVAACNIRGLTVHSWSGLAVSKPGDTEADIIGASLRSGPAKMRWKNTDILVIDEISMISNETLEMLSHIAKRQRNDNRPFGGIQLVLCGDFFQLPPVNKGGKVKYCFEAPSWKQLFENGRTDGIVVLDVVFRQKEDTLFLQMLNEIRKGEVTKKTREVLWNKAEESKAQKLKEGKMSEKEKEDLTRIRPTKLFSTNKDVDKYNQCELKRLADREGEDSEVHKYTAFDAGQEPYLKQLIQGTKAPQDLELRVGAQVMLLKNLSVEDGLVNGSRGTVVRFEPSRGRSNKFRYIPVVKFMVTLGSDITYETVVIKEEDFSTKVGDEEKAVRIQLPLMLAWALSIHKSQGMTIPLLEVSFNRIFECGQAYVALSRATDLRGLTLMDFNTACIRANPEVIKFYETRSGKSAGSEGGGGYTSDLVSTSVTALSASFLGGELPPPPPLDDDGWMENKRELLAAAAVVRAETDAAIRRTVVVKDESGIASSLPVNPYSVSRAEMKRQEAARETNPFRAYEYDDWLEKKVPISNNGNAKQPVAYSADHEGPVVGPFSVKSESVPVSVGIKREWSESSSSGSSRSSGIGAADGSAAAFAPAKRAATVPGPFSFTPEPTSSNTFNLVSDSTTSTESSPSVYDLTEDLDDRNRPFSVKTQQQHHLQPTKRELVVQNLVEQEEPHYFTRPPSRPLSSGASMQRSSSYNGGSSGSSGGVSGSAGWSGGVAMPLVSHPTPPQLHHQQQSVNQNLPPRPSSSGGGKTGLALSSFIEPLKRKQPYVPPSAAGGSAVSPAVKYHSASSGDNGSGSGGGGQYGVSPGGTGYASTSNSGGFSSGFNPYAPTKNVIKIKDMSTSNGSGNGSNPVGGSSAGGSGGPPPAKIELTEEQKRRIEANKQAALKKLAEAKLRRQEELQKARETYIV